MAQGQYYFNDIIAQEQTQEKYNLFRKHKVKKIIANSFETDNTPTQGFSLVQELQIDGKKMTTELTTGSNIETITSIYELSKLKRTSTNKTGINTKTDYSYTDKGQIAKIISTTTDTVLKIPATEVHEWSYNKEGKPIQMLKIKNNIDTTIVSFLLDEQGLVIEEYWKKKTKVIEKYYYYYDADKQLTDIVRFNIKAKKLLPDAVYEYNANHQLIKAMQVSAEGRSVVYWEYTYNIKGLKESETARDKEQRMLGKIVYSYE